jgi:hypothetical protein
MKVAYWNILPWSGFLKYFWFFNRELYGKLRDVMVPQMYLEQTRRRVLVMEWIEVRSVILFNC